ncbi:hypothetical protein, partial [Petrocella sp. FN5]|uniref:hypothetical protein n=1 Tax=Petrocella sp. FN5 TaxID=3032002 RepID=UPI0023DBB2C5
MRNKAMIIWMLALLVSATACSKTENQQEDKKTSKQVANTIDFDLKIFDDLSIAKRELNEKVINYLVENPVIRLDYFPLEGNEKIEVKINN